MKNKSRAQDRIYDVAIIGGGVAGAAAAIHLAEAGFDVIVFEKENQPHHKVCGELISGEGVALLEELGVPLDGLDAAHISNFRLHGPRESCAVPLPFAARGLSRERLDDAVLKRAETAGAEVRRGVLVREWIDGLDAPGCAIVIATNEDEVRSRRLIVATGTTNFNSAQERAGRDSSLIGFKMHLRLKPSAMAKLKNHCDLFVFEGGYGGLSQIENGLANFCFLIERKLVKEIGSDWNSLASHVAYHCRQASHFLEEAEPQFERFVTIGQIPYGFLRRDPAIPGLFFVGDQMAVIPSITGDGISIALFTAREAAAAMMAELGELAAEPQASRAFQMRVRRRLRPQIAAAFQLHRLFLQPRLVDLSTRVIQKLPWLVKTAFRLTTVGSTRHLELASQGEAQLIT